MTAPKIIEIHLGVDLVGPEEAVLPKEREGPVTLRITPFKALTAHDGFQRGDVQFRVEFEPENEERRSQPLRAGLAEEFPGGWKYGDPWKDKK